MNLLAIDTASTRLQLGLLQDDGSIDGRVDTLVEEMAQGHAERIFPAIAELLATGGLAYADLDRLAVTTGPGSFTGLRIGLAAARGLALALGIPAVGVPSLQAISLRGAPHQPVIVQLDARRGEAWFQHFLAPGQPIDNPVVLPREEALRRVPSPMTPIETPYPDIGALARYAARLTPAHFPPEPQYVREADARPQEGARIARVAAP